jgi:preprotein translocase subunit SecE
VQRELKVMAGIKAYFEESYSELMHKVSWPTWKELQSSSIVVLIASMIIALIVFVMDYVFGVNSGDSVWKGVLGFFYNLF